MNKSDLQAKKLERPITRSKARKIKELDGGFSQGMVAIIEEDMNIKLIEQDRSANIEVLG